MYYPRTPAHPPIHAHPAELGHWKLRHTPVAFTISQANILLQFLLFTYMRNSKEIYHSFGFTEVQPAFIAFAIFQFIISPMDEVRGLGRFFIVAPGSGWNKGGRGLDGGDKYAADMKG
jgi:hypothetical protein